MNYIGSKQKLLPFIAECITQVTNDDFESLCDIFAGTGSVGIHYKKQDKEVISNDLQYYSYCRLKHYIENTEEYDLLFKGEPLTSHEFIKAVFGKDDVETHFIRDNYPKMGRLYFKEENARRIDYMRQNIETAFRSGWIDERHYFLCLTMLLESADKVSNVASTYGAFLKRIKETAQHDMSLTYPEVIHSDRNCLVFNEDANELISRIDSDVLYLDPPYNARQYASNYHILETIAKYDNPQIGDGVTGIRKWKDQKSLYCSKSKVAAVLDDLLSKTRSKYVFLSYNNEGLLSFDEIQRIMGRYGNYGQFRKEYQRFKADSNREYKSDKTEEFLHYIVR